MKSLYSSGSVKALLRAGAACAAAVPDRNLSKLEFKVALIRLRRSCCKRGMLFGNGSAAAATAVQANKRQQRCDGSDATVTLQLLQLK